MELKTIEAIIEAILFAAGDEVSSESICRILELDKKTFVNIMKSLIDKYNNEKRGIQIIQIEDKYQMCTRHEYYDFVKQLKEPRNRTGLSQAALETLSIIAYKQPVTRAYIEKVRGVGCDTSIERLLEKNLIAEIGRMDAPGRPTLFGTTDEFLRSFGINSIKELPPLDMIFEDINEEMQERMEEDAE